MVKKSITYSLPVLKNLISSETSFVYCYENCKRCFFANPLQLVNIKNAVTEYLKSKITTYDPELQGIILSHKNIKVVNSVQLNDDGECSLNYIADIYVFKPNIGSILTGRVNKKGQDHLGVLVHSVFNATIPRPRNEDECPKTWASHIKIGDQVRFEVVKVNFLGRLPYIEGKLVEVEERDTEDGDSGIGGHESTEEVAFNKTSPSLDTFLRKNIIDEKISILKGKTLINNSPAQSRRKSSISGLQSSLLNEALERSNFSNPEKNAGNETSILDDSTSNKSQITKEKRSSKKRKSSPSRLEIENSFIKSAVENLKNPELPKVKRKKMSDSGSPESTIDSLISTEISSLSPTNKKKLSVGVGEVKIHVMDNSLIKNADETLNSPGLANEYSPKIKKKKKSISEDLKESLEKESSESIINHLVNSESSSMTPTKNKLSIDAREVNVSHKHNTTLTPEREFLLGSKKKKKSVSFLDPEISSVDYVQDRFSGIIPSDEKEYVNSKELDNEIAYASKEHKKTKKKRSTLVLYESPSNLINSVEINSEGGNFEGEMEESNEIIKKKKRKSSLSRELQENLINNTIDDVINELNDNQNIEEGDIHNLSKEHKKKKRKSSLSRELQENLINNTIDDVINELNDNQNIEEGDIHNLSKEHKKKKKKKSSLLMETGHWDNLEGINVISQDNCDAQQESPQLKEHRKKKKKHSGALTDVLGPDISVSVSEDLSESKLDISSTSDTTEGKLKKKKKRKSKDKEMENYL